jgi:hypothetical protein
MTIICCSFTNETTFFSLSLFHHLPENEMKRKTQSSLDLSILCIKEWIMHIPQNELAGSTNCDNNETTKNHQIFSFLLFINEKCLVCFGFLCVFFLGK